MVAPGIGTPKVGPFSLREKDRMKEYEITVVFDPLSPALSRRERGSAG
jgi:hypothetical protein